MTSPVASRSEIDLNHRTRWWTSCEITDSAPLSTPTTRIYPSSSTWIVAVPYCTAASAARGPCTSAATATPCTPPLSRYTHVHMEVCLSPASQKENHSGLLYKEHTTHDYICLGFTCRRSLERSLLIRKIKIHLFYAEEEAKKSCSLKVYIKE